jgi:hypothetical protein
VTEAMTHPGPCQVRIYTESPCLGRAEVEILGIPFCEACARQQEAYLSIGELTHVEGRDLRHETEDPSHLARSPEASWITLRS